MQPHPGPVKRHPKFPCQRCNKGVIKTSKAVKCTSCENFIHVKCGKIQDSVYNSYKNGAPNFNFTCEKC